MVFEPETTIAGLRRQLEWLAAIAKNLRVPASGPDGSSTFTPRAQAALHLSGAAMAIARGDVSRSQSALAFAYGYLMALYDNSRSKQLDEAQAALEAKAQSSVERVRFAAEPFRVGRLSKAAVAARISTAVGLSATRVETLLSRIYPGGTWKKKTPVVSDRDDGS